MKWPCSTCPPHQRLMIALPSRGSGEDIVAAVMTVDGDVEQGLRSMPSPASHTYSQLPLCQWAFQGVTNKEWVKSKMGIILHRLSDGSLDPVMRLSVLFFIQGRSRCVPGEEVFKYFLCQGHSALSDVLHGACQPQQGRNLWLYECPTELVIILLVSLTWPISSQD